MTILPLLLLLLLTALDDAPDANTEADLQSVFDRAVRYQRGDVPRSRPESFHGRFYVTARNREGESINATVERYYTRQPERMLTTRVDSLLETDSSVGFNEGVAWFRDNKGGRVIIYSDDPEAFDVDLEQLDFQLLITPLILDAAVLDSLLPRLQSTRLLEPGVFVDIEGKSHAVDVVAAVMDDDLFGPDPNAPPPAPSDPSPRLAVRLEIDRQTGALWALSLETLDRSVPRIVDIAFGFHEFTSSGLRVPANIQVFENRAVAPSVVLGVLPSEDQLTVRFDIDVPVDPAMFSVPEDES